MLGGVTSPLSRRESRVKGSERRLPCVKAFASAFGADLLRGLRRGIEFCLRTIFFMPHGGRRNWRGTGRNQDPLPPAAANCSLPRAPPGATAGGGNAGARRGKRGF